MGGTKCNLNGIKNVRSMESRINIFSEETGSVDCGSHPALALAFQYSQNNPH